MSSSPSRDPWGDFWARNARGASVGGGTGCLPQRWAAIENAQRATWTAFAKHLPENAAVLDLATGDGRVLGWLLDQRADLSLTGIDLAATLPAGPTGTKTIGGVPMEQLPFEDDSLQAVVSQFGFEYGDVAKVTKEIARVLAPGGQVGLIVHRGDGPILEHNRQRRNELQWALKEKATARKVKAKLKANPPAIGQAEALAKKTAELGAKRFGQTSPAWEIPEAIRRTVVMGRREGPASMIDTIEVIEGHARNELGRIASLATACGTADKRVKLVGAFETHGLTLAEENSLKEPSGRAFADFLRFK
ncbi:MAG: class I SAM-dependent methyltransferase [Pseudomonadota bacterium]